VKPRMSSLSKFVVAAVCILLFGSVAQAGTEKVLHTFAFTDGENPYTGVLFDGAGNLYGTTFYGGGAACNAGGCGVVFKMAPAIGGGWTESTVYAFTGGADGSHPYSALIFDAAGNLYGATYGAYSGGGTGVGTVFRLTPNPDGSWSFALLHTFTGGKDGIQPNGSLVFDSAGNLYGTTRSGGSYNAGIVFGLTPTTHGQWKETLLHAFTGGQDGSAPFALTSDAAGNLFGTTNFGGTPACSCGVVFELSRSSSGSWKETILHSFTGGKDGAIPQSLVFDSSGNLYGAAERGGITNNCFAGCGVVFKLTRGSHNVWRETVLHKFDGVNGLEPSGLTFDNSGTKLYGSAYSSAVGVGLIFDLVPDDNWAETVAYEFSGSFVNGAEPVGPLVLDSAGNVYGTTILGGSNDVGVVFEVTP